MVSPRVHLKHARSPSSTHPARGVAERFLVQMSDGRCKSEEMGAVLDVAWDAVDGRNHVVRYHLVVGLGVCAFGGMVLADLRNTEIVEPYVGLGREGFPFGLG